MALTPAQKAIVKAYIDADPVLSAFPPIIDGSYEIAKALNLYPAADFMAWNTSTPVKAIYDAISWEKYTPTDAADGTAIYTNRVLAIQTKQINLQNMLQGRDYIDATKANIRAGLRDAVIQLPAGAAGALVTAGGTSGTTVLTACTRKSNVIEKLLAVGNATTGSVTANLLVFEGAISPDEVQDARVN